VQPLVETAVRHGLEPRERGGTIVIAARDDGTHTEISVDDDGVGMQPAELRALLAAGERTDHVGLRNVDARVRRIYGDDHALVVETNPATCSAQFDPVGTAKFTSACDIAKSALITKGISYDTRPSAEMDGHITTAGRTGLVEREGMGVRPTVVLGSDPCELGTRQRRRARNQMA
jgi:hypothetical protein